MPVDLIYRVDTRYGHRTTFKSVYRGMAYGQSRTFAELTCCMCAVFDIGKYNYIIDRPSPGIVGAAVGIKVYDMELGKDLEEYTFSVPRTEW